MPMDMGGGAPAATSSIAIEAFDLGFKPAEIAVPAAGTYDVSFHNTGSTLHDLTFADGTKVSADAGATVTGKVTVPAGGLSFLCSIPGHADAGMQGSISVAGATAAAPAAAAQSGTTAAAAPVADPAAPPYVLRDATAPAVLPGTVHDVDFPIIDKDITVAEGFVVHAWTFGGTVPGPTLRVHLGDTVRVHLTNQTQMSHSIDFHASQTAMNDQMVEIKPGDDLHLHLHGRLRGRLDVPLRHGPGPAPHRQRHVRDGDRGAEGRPAEGRPGGRARPERVVPGRPGTAGRLRQGQCRGARRPTSSSSTAWPTSTRTTRSRSPPRVASGSSCSTPARTSTARIHVVGTIFDTVVKEGIVLARGNAQGWGSQAVDLAPAQGAIIEFSPQEDGMYPMVTHAFNFVGKGAIGIFMAGDGDPKN